MKLKSLKPKVRQNLRGIFQFGVPYEVRNPSGDWAKYFGTYEGQKHNDVDSNCCWAFAGNENLEDSLTWLRENGKFSQETINWFISNGYIDKDNDFYLARRWIPIWSGVRDQGNDQAEFARLSQIYGAIPNSLLPFTTVDAYFNKSDVTKEMVDLGREFLKRVSIAYQEVGTRWGDKTLDQLKKALLQSELQIGVPVPEDGSWNRVRVKWNGDKEPAHSIALYKIDESSDYDFPIFIYDQYNPTLKQLSRDTYIPLVTQMIVSAKNEVMLSPKLTLSVWQKAVKILIDLGIISN